MDRRAFMHHLRETLPLFRLGRMFVPIGQPTNASEVTFRGFGIDNAGDIFSKGWQFTIQTNSPAKSLQAFQSGNISFHPSNAASGTVNRLILVCMDAVGALLRTEKAPAWFPAPKYVIYEGIEELETRALLNEYLISEPKIFQSLLRYWDRTLSVNECLDEFFANNLPSGIPLPAGQIIGTAKQQDSSTRVVSIYMQTQKGSEEGLYLDPAIYHKHWELFFEDLAGHPLEEELKSLRFGIVANGVVRYIRSNGIDTGPYTDPASPARLLSLAVDEAGPYDTIVFLDSATYHENDEVVLAEPITITALNNDDVIETATPNLPTLDGRNERRLIRIGGPVISRVYDGEEEIVSICNLIITRGFRDAAAGVSAEPDWDYRATKAGAGLAIHRFNQVYIRNCYLHHNHTQLTGVQISLSSEVHALQLHEAGIGGGILAYYSSPLIFHNRITENSTDRRGGGIGIWGYGWPHIEDNLIAQNTAEDGGGVAIEIALPSLATVGAGSITEHVPEWGWSSDDLARAKSNQVRIIRNHIIENTASDDGGGVYMSVHSRTSFEANVIQSNRAARAGGGVRASLGCEVFLHSDVIIDNEANLSGGGGIAARNSSLLLVDVTLESNSANGFAGGGVYFSTSDEGKTPFAARSWVKPDYNDILIGVFRATHFFLALEGNTRVIQNRSTMIVDPSTMILNDRRKGGGLYVLRFEGNDQFGDFFMALPLKVIIENIDLVADNQLPGPVNPPASADSVQIHIDDMVNRPVNPIDDVNKSEFQSGNSLIYESL